MEGFWITTYSLDGISIGDRIHANRAEAEARASRMNKRRSANHFKWEAHYVVPAPEEDDPLDPGERIE